MIKVIEQYRAPERLTIEKSKVGYFGSEWAAMSYFTVNLKYAIQCSKTTVEYTDDGKGNISIIRHMADSKATFRNCSECQDLHDALKERSPNE